MKIKELFGKLMAGIWRHKYIWTLVFFVVSVGFVDENSYWNRFRLEKENAARNAVLQKLEAQYSEARKKLDDIKTNPQTLVRVAREVHQMKSANEDVYYFVEVKDEASTE